MRIRTPCSPPGAQLSGSAGLSSGTSYGRVRGWALTVRQEVHPDQFHRLRELVEWIAARTSTCGTIGYLRFLEHDIPDVLIADPATGTAQRLPLMPGSAAEDVIPDPWG
ncbi:putative protein OS=Streptomyces glaucescens OX=1907 GN=SGLAU_31925 PE=4 SV=1 [Streptomyces glaucescens]